MSELPKVSYVIGVKNMENTIGNTIESILNQNYPNKEIIVIDGESTDNTIGIIKKYPIKILTEKTGISNARNLGYKNSTGDYIAFTDADCELDPQWTKKMLEGFYDECVGLVGARIELKTDGSYTSIYRKVELSKRQDNLKSKEVVFAGGAGLMFRRKVLKEIGGFNPKWVNAEDSESSFLTISHGYKVIRKNDAIAYHVPESRFKKVVKNGFRDSKAYVRATKAHPKTSLKNKFNTTWYFPFDMVLLPLLYLFLIISCILYPIFLIMDYHIQFLFILKYFLFVWWLILILVILFILIYGTIPSYQVASYSENKKIRNFLCAMILHHTRGLAWGYGLIIGILRLIFRKKRN